MHYFYKSPHKDSSATVRACVCVCECIRSFPVTCSSKATHVHSDCSRVKFHTFSSGHVQESENKLASSHPERVATNAGLA